MTEKLLLSPNGSSEQLISEFYSEKKMLPHHIDDLAVCSTVTETVRGKLGYKNATFEYRKGKKSTEEICKNANEDARSITVFPDDKSIIYYIKFGYLNSREVEANQIFDHVLSTFKFTN